MKLLRSFSAQQLDLKVNTNPTFSLLTLPYAQRSGLVLKIIHTSVICT
jgi:hypothetical protein